MEKDLFFLRLWDTYNAVLTSTQREITNLYLNCDLSLGEIAEEKGCSRQSVSDCLNKSRRQLTELEEKLHFAEKQEALEAWANGLEEPLKAQLTSILERG